MAKTKAPASSNPIIPDVAIEIEDESYRLCFDFQALADAKGALKAQGVEINVLRSIDFSSLDVDTLPALFFAAARRYQPQLSWKRAQQIVNVRTASSIAVGLFAAWKGAMAKPSKNPTRAAQEK
jgi:hypothetical protein